MLTLIPVGLIFRNQSMLGLFAGKVKAHRAQEATVKNAKKCGHRGHRKNLEMKKTPSKKLR